MHIKYLFIMCFVSPFLCIWSPFWLTVIHLLLWNILSLKWIIDRNWAGTISYTWIFYLCSQLFFLLRSGRFHLSVSGWQLKMPLVYLNGHLVRRLKRMKTDRNGFKQQAAVFLTALARFWNTKNLLQLHKHPRGWNKGCRTQSSASVFLYQVLEYASFLASSHSKATVTKGRPAFSSEKSLPANSVFHLLLYALLAVLQS